jgi:hypothetical protein
METAWIQVFVLTLTQCIAPAGKMVCQEETVDYQFTNEEDCASALVQLVDLAARSDKVIVDRQRSNCHPAARLANSEGFVLIDGKTPPPDFMQARHEERLKNMKTCEETSGVAPCKIGEIILEAASEAPKPEIWQRRN